MMRFGLKKHISWQVITDVAALIFFLVYLLLSVFFAEARLLYSDSAYYLFRMIEVNGFNIEHGRYIGYLTQWIPVIFIKLKLPLKYIMVGYSLNVALLFFLGYLFTRYFLKASFLALGVILLCTVSVHYSYYFICSEIVQGLVPTYISIIFIYKIARSKNAVKLQDLFLLVTMSVLVFVSHLFLSAVYVCFVMIFLAGNFTKRNIVITSMVFSLMGLRLLMSMNNGYDSGKLEIIVIENLNWKLIKASYMYYFLKTSFNGQLFIVQFLFFVALIFGIWKQKFLASMAMVVLVLGVMITIYLYMPNGDALAYMDSYLGIIGLIVTSFFMILVDEHTPKSTLNKIGLLLIVLACLSLHRIIMEPIYQNRIAYYKSLFQEMDKERWNKVVIDAKDAQWNYFLVGWGVPFESLLLSSLHGSSKTVYIDDGHLERYRLNDPNLFLGEVWDPYHSMDRLNPRYFNFPSDGYHWYK